MKRLIQSGGSGRRIDEVRRKVKIEFRRTQTPNQIFVRKVQTTSLSALDFLRVLARAYAYYYANFSIFTFTLKPIPSPYHCMKNTGNIWHDYLRSGCTKKILPYSNRLRTIHTKKHGSRPRLSTSAKVLQYSRGSTRVLSGQYSSTAIGVLEYSYWSTRVFLLKYSDAPVFCSPFALFPQNKKGSFSYGKGRSSKNLGTFLRPLRPC